MKLNDFEKYIDRTILSRGREYYDNGCVERLEKTDDNCYEAEVAGTAAYSVEVELDGQDNIIDTICDCPYNMGKYCKHQVAVFFFLRNIRSEGTDMDSAGRAAAAALNSASSIETLLLSRTKEELVNFLVDAACQHEEIRQRLELEFNAASEQDEIRKARDLIRMFISKNSDRHGFVAYDAVYEAVKGAELVLDKARAGLATGKHEHAADLTLCVIGEMMDLLDKCDDSGGETGFYIEDCIGLFGEISEDEGLGIQAKERLFEKLVAEAFNKRYEGWNDWRLDLLDICSTLADSPALREKMEKTLAALLNNRTGSWNDSYFNEKVNMIIYNMILRDNGKKEAQKYIEQNIRYPDFRRMAIAAAIKEKDYDRVIQLAHEGEEANRHLPGLVAEWKQYQYKAYECAGKLDQQRGIALDFVISGSYEYYENLKKTYDSSEWLSVYPRIILILENQKKIHTSIYTQILIAEGEKQKLLEVAKIRPASIELYYNHLVPDFEEEVYELFRLHIEHTAGIVSDRNGYQRVCGIIRSLIKAGGKGKAEELKQKLSAQYAKKPAFRDELSKI